MAGYADELSLKLTARDEMSARLKGVQKELEAVSKKMKTTSDDLKRTGSPEAAAELKKLETEFERLAKSQQEAARASKAARDAIKKMQSEAARATTAMGRLGQSITKHAKTIRNAGLVMGAAMLLFAKQSVQAFAEAEKQAMQLSQAYGRFPKINDVTRASFDALNTSIMNMTGADDDALAGAEALLARFDLTGKQIQEIMPLVNDFAMAMGKDVGDAATTIGKSLLGNAKALKDAGVNYKATGDRAKDYASILAILQEKVGGVGQAFGGTTAGQLAIANQNFQNLQESVGASLVPALQTMVGVMKPAVAMFTALPDPLKQAGILVGLLGAAAMIATPRLIAFNGALSNIGVSLGALGPLAAILIGGAAGTIQAYNAGEKLNSGQTSLGQTLNENAGILGFMSIGFSNIRSVIGKVTGATEENTQATVTAKEAAKDATSANDAQAESLSKVTVFTNSARSASLGLARALGKVAAILDRDDAAKAYRKSIRDYIKKPSIDAAKETTRAFLTVMGTFKDGSKAQSDFALKHLPEVERAIKTSGMGASLRRQLLAPLEQARRAAIRVQETIDLLHGKRIAITYTGGTPTNPGGYHRAAGGAVFGPGSATSDSIPAMLSNGEYVIRAAAAQAIGYGTLDRLNIADRMPSMPAIVNAPTITLPSTATGRDAPLVGQIIMQPTGQVDLELALAREARRQDRDRRTRHAGSTR